MTTLVLLHGAGDTARVWGRTQQLLRTPSVAVDLLGRASRPFDLARLGVEVVAEHAAADVRAATAGPVVLVGHSAGGVIAVRLAGLLRDQVQRLVLVAGISAPEGGEPADQLHPERRPQFEAMLPRLRAEHAGASYARGDAVAELPHGLRAIENPEVVRAIDSLSFMLEPVSWRDVAPDLPRTFVRPLGDQLQTRAMQDRLIAAAAAREVIEIDADHTPMRSAPEALARILDELAGRHVV